MLNRSSVMGACTAFTAAYLSLALHAQQAPPRDAAPALVPVRTGTAAITGVVVDGGSGQPVRRVSVTITDQGTSGIRGRLSVTDDDGRFAFRALPAGRFLVSAAKAAYVATAYGMNKVMRPGAVPTGSAIALAEGQQASDVTLRITRGSVITGTVRDPSGRPLRGAVVGLAYSTRVIATGDRSLVGVPSGSATTDGRGVYRIFGVPPGDYIASVGLSGIVTGDLESTTETDVQRVAALMAGRAAGSGLLTQPNPAGAAGPAAPRRSTHGYATVFYPGTTSLSNALMITLAPGEERGGVDFQLQLVPQSRVSGVVTGPDGKPMPGVSVRVFPNSPFAGGPFGSGSFGTTDAMGQFLLKALAAGDYVMEARSAGGLLPPGMPTAPGAQPAKVLWARADVSIASGADQRLDVTMRPGLTISGQITVDPGVTDPAPDFARMRLYVARNRDGQLNAATVTPDGQFSISGIPMDSYRYLISAPPGPVTAVWYPKIGTIDSRDAIDSLVAVSGDVTDAKVVLTTRVSEVAGAIFDSMGQPAREYFIVVFPADKALWTWGSRRIQQMRPASDGKFSFKNLPAGEYLIGAVTDLEQGQWYEPAFLTELLGASVKITLADGEKKVQDIRLK